MLESWASPVGLQYFSTGSAAEVRGLETDLVSWEHLLTGDELALRATTRHWVRHRFEPWLAQVRPGDALSPHLVQELGDLGALGAGHTAKQMGSVAAGLMMQELERGDSGLSRLSSVQTCLVMPSLLRFGSTEQQAKYLPELQQGNLLGCFGLHETPVMGPGVTARRDGRDYILNGAKSWVVAAPIADLAVVWAQVMDGDEGQVQGFVVEKGTSGMELAKIPSRFSSGVCPAGGIFFEECRVSADSIMPSSEGLRGALSCVNKIREAIAWGVTGAALSCYEAALQSGTGNDPQNATHVADMAGNIVTSQLLSLHYGRCSEMGRLTPLQINLHKRNNVASALKVANSAKQVLGPDAIWGATLRHCLNIEEAASSEGDKNAHDKAIWLCMGKER